MREGKEFIMACHEIAGLRLGLMNVLGIEDEHAKQHELTELGPAAGAAGPIAPMIRANNLYDLKRLYAQSLTALAEKVAQCPASDPQIGYYRALLITTKKVQLELDRLDRNLRGFYKDLDEVHDFIHEVFPR
jgi:hypothetical protein